MEAVALGSLSFLVKAAYNFSAFLNGTCAHISFSKDACMYFVLLMSTTCALLQRLTNAKSLKISSIIYLLVLNDF